MENPFNFKVFLQKNDANYIPQTNSFPSHCKGECIFLLQDREKFSQQLTETEDWLYEEGEDQKKQVYIDKLALLKV